MPQTTLPVEILTPGTTAYVIFENKIRCATVSRVDIEGRQVYNQSGSDWTVHYLFDTIVDDDNVPVKIGAKQVADTKEHLVAKL